MYLHVGIWKPTGYASLDDIPDDYKFMPIRRAWRMREELSKLFDGIDFDWSNPSWGALRIRELDVVFEIRNSPEENVSYFQVRISGKGDPEPICAVLCKQFAAKLSTTKP